MQAMKKPSFFTLLLMISFASVNAVLFTPALPDIANFFAITNDSAQLTIIWFLIGYAIGQLLYGPIANRFGRKPALFLGVGLQITSSLICIAAGKLHLYPLLVIGRFLLALGSGVGLKMTFTLVNECYEPKIASQKISYLMLAFAFTPALSVALGGILNSHYGWMSCFYAGMIYGVVLFVLVSRLPETLININYDALKLQYLIRSYTSQFKNTQLVANGFLIGSATSFVYVFAALAPFIAMNMMGMNSAEYGIANLLPALGLIVGSLCSARLALKTPLQYIIFMGILIAICGVILMLVNVTGKYSALFAIFIPMTIIYLGLPFINANASAIALSRVTDKSQGSAVLNFINMGIATVVVICIGYININTILLPMIYVILCVIMLGVYKILSVQNNLASK